MAWVTADHPTPAELNSCVQCGLCLPVCPTFRMTGRETSSPRGRIHAMAAVADGVVEVDEAFADILDQCLGCRACEPVCPGLMPYGRALEGARAEIVAQVPGRQKERKWMVTSALRSRSLLKISSNGLSLAQSTGTMGLVPGKFRRLTEGARKLRGRPPAVVGHSGGSGEAGRVALLAGCIQDQWFRPVNHAAITLLEMAGYEVESPTEQVCCGALAAHDGRADEAHRLEAANTGVFADFDLVVATAAGCSAHLATYAGWAEQEDPQVLDITVVIARAIAEGLLPTLEADRGPVAVQDPCHLRHAQRVVDEPRSILRAAGYETVEIDPDAFCCGAAGIYAIAQPEMSEMLGNQKASQVRSTGVSLVASANPGCEMQLRRHLDDDYVISHPIELYLTAVQESQTAT